MNRITRQLAKFTLLTLLSLSLYLPATITLAADSDICQWVNLQNGSLGGDTLQYPEAKPNETAEEKQKRIDAFNKAYNEALKNNQSDKAKMSTYQNKIVVINEETLGKPSNNLSASCARVTTCSLGNYDLNKTSQIRRCFTTYDTIDKCTDTTPPTVDDVTNSDKPYKYCEVVQVYFSDGGTSLLYGYMGQIYRYVAYIGGFIAVLVLIMGGIMRSAAGDNTEMISKANALITRCITGLVVLFLSAVILYTINPNFFVF